MSENTPESEAPETDEPQPEQTEPLQVSEPVFDIIEKGDKHDHETRERDMETKESD